MSFLAFFDKTDCQKYSVLVSGNPFYTYEHMRIKRKKGITITNAFQKILDKSNHKPKKIWINKGSEFYNISRN